MKLRQAPRQLQRVNLPVTSGVDEAEWWIVAATKEEFSAAEVVAPAEQGQLILLTDDPKHPADNSWLPHWGKFLESHPPGGSEAGTAQGCGGFGNPRYLLRARPQCDPRAVAWVFPR